MAIPEGAINTTVEMIHLPDQPTDTFMLIHLGVILIVFLIATRILFFGSVNSLMDKIRSMLTDWNIKRKQ